MLFWFVFVLIGILGLLTVFLECMALSIPCTIWMKPEPNARTNTINENGSGNVRRKRGTWKLFFFLSPKRPTLSPYGLYYCGRQFYDQTIQTRLSDLVLSISCISSVHTSDLKCGLSDNVYVLLTFCHCKMYLLMYGIKYLKCQNLYYIDEAVVPSICVIMLLKSGNSATHETCVLRTLDL